MRVRSEPATATSASNDHRLVLYCHERARREPRRAGGFYASRAQPPCVGGEGLDRIELVTHCDGLDAFSVELTRTVPLRIDDFEIRVLRIDRVLASKVAANRPKDRASIEQLNAAIAAIEASKRR